MKKFVLAGLAVLIALSFAVCEFGRLGDNEGETVNVVYSQDGKSLTLYLDGGVPVTASSRSLNADIAKKGHDFYEVVFLDDAGIPAYHRTSWTIGESAAIRGLSRTTGGSNWGVPSKAILFVGRKSDAALLAIGLLTGTDGTTSTIVTSTTKSVTFTVDSLMGSVQNFEAVSTVAGTVNYTAAMSSAASYGGKNYPVFSIDSNDATITATYTINTVSSGITALLPSIKIGTYANSSSDSHGALIRELRIPNGSGGYFEFQSLGLGTKAVIASANITADSNFNNVISFALDTTGADTGLCALTFSIPVYALDTADALTWYIRPGFGTYRFDLDDGTAGALGGAVILSVGEYTSDTLQIRY